jgi:uncharacterized protein (TIGR03437 family)
MSPTQINLQAPDDSAAGIVRVVVTTPSGSGESTVILGVVGPSFDLLDNTPSASYCVPMALAPTAVALMTSWVRQA